MSELKRTQLYDIHVAAGAELVDFGGWEMPIQYPSGIIAEHLYTRQVCSLFDVSHMGRLRITGPERKAFLQHVLSSNVSAELRCSRARAPTAARTGRSCALPSTRTSTSR